MKAPFAYFGGKTGMAAEIVSLMPPHRVYIEPFFGSGAVFFRKPRVVHEILNDLEDSVVNFFRVLRDRPEDLERVCRLTPYARKEYAVCADLGAGDELERARRFWVRINQGFGKSAKKTTGWSVTTARTQSTAASVIGRIDRFAACSQRLMQTSIECRDAIELIVSLATADTLIYADPPYVFSTRRGQNGSGTNDYRQDMGDETSHRDLAEVLHATPATVILSGYPGPLYGELYGDWWRQEYEVTGYASNARAVSRTGRIECLWSNRDLDQGRQGSLL